LTLGPAGTYTAYPSEGGHAEFAPRSPVRINIDAIGYGYCVVMFISFVQLEVKMLTHLVNKFHAKCRVSVERVVSGTGLGNVSAHRCVNHLANNSKHYNRIIGVYFSC
jgi:glucokinase